MTPTLRAKALVNNKAEITSLVIAKPVSSRECDVDVCVVDARYLRVLEDMIEDCHQIERDVLLSCTVCKDSAFQYARKLLRQRLDQIDSLRAEKEGA
jgi:hypothetical protein